MRRKGTPMYPHKTKQGSYWITLHAWRRLKAAAKRTGKSDSDVIEFCLRASAEQLTKMGAELVSESGGRG